MKNCQGLLLLSVSQPVNKAAVGDGTCAINGIANPSPQSAMLTYRIVLLIAALALCLFLNPIINAQLPELEDGYKEQNAGETLFDGRTAWFLPDNRTITVNTSAPTGVDLSNSTYLDQVLNVNNYDVTLTGSNTIGFKIHNNDYWYSVDNTIVGNQWYINVNSLSGGQGIFNDSNNGDDYYYYNGGTNTVKGVNIDVGSSSDGRYNRNWTGNAGIVNGSSTGYSSGYYWYGGYDQPTPNLSVQDSEIIVGSGSIGLINYDVLEVVHSNITTSYSTGIAIRNGYDESIHIIEQPDLVWQIQYWDPTAPNPQGGTGAWVNYTDNTPEDALGPGSQIQYRLAVAPTDENPAYTGWGTWTRTTLGEGFELSGESIKTSENATALPLPKKPDSKESYTNYADANAVLIVDSTNIEAWDVAIENHGTVTVQNGSSITTGSMGVGILSEYVQRVYKVNNADRFIYEPSYYYSNNNNNITVDNSVITGTGSTAIKTQAHLFYRIAPTDDDPRTAPTGPEDGFYASLYQIGWTGDSYYDYYYEDEENAMNMDDRYVYAGRNIRIVNGSRLGEDPNAPADPNDPNPSYRERVGTGIDFSGDWHSIYIDSTSQINASQYGITSTGTPVYGWDGHDDHEIGNYAGVRNRIIVEGQIRAGDVASQAPVVGVDRLTHQPLPYDFSSPETDDFKKYVVVTIDPITGREVMTPAIDPATVTPAAPEGKPYVDVRSGVQIVTIQDIAATGTGIFITGDSLAWDRINGPGGGAWSGYYGPVVSEIDIIGPDAMVWGGKAAIEIGTFGQDNATHVSKILTGRNDEVMAFNTLLNPNSNQKRENQTLCSTFDNMSTAQRAFVLDRLDVGGVKGDIISWYNGVAGWAAENRVIRVSNATFLEGDFKWYSTSMGFSWMQYQDNSTVSYFSTVGNGVGNFNSKLIGHRDFFPDNDVRGLSPWWTGGPSGRSVILDEILLQRNFATVVRNTAPGDGGDGTGTDNGGGDTGGGDTDVGDTGGDTGTDTDDSGAVAAAAAATPRAPGTPVTSEVSNLAAGALEGLHFRAALERLLAEYDDDDLYALTGLTRTELKEGLTRDGTLLKFGDDIYSGTILGGGFGALHTVGKEIDRQGNIDVQFTSLTESQTQTTIFNNNTAYFRNAIVKADGHLLLNNATLIIDKYKDNVELSRITDGVELARTTGNVDLTRLVIHDFINEGKLSGSGTLYLSERGEIMYAGYFVNEGILAPGLPGYIGTNYNNAKFVDGGLTGEIKFNGSLHLEDIGTLEVTLADHTIGDVMAYYLREKPPTGWQPDIDDPTERQAIWDSLRAERTSTRLAWVDGTADVIPAALQTNADTLSAEITARKKIIATIPKGNQQRQQLEDELFLRESQLAKTQRELDNRAKTLADTATLLQRYGMSDLLDVKGKSHLDDPNFKNGEDLRMGGTLKLDRLWDSDGKLANNSYIVAVSDKIATGDDGLYSTFSMATSDTLDLVFVNASLLPNRLATGQYGVVLSVVDDAHWYQNYLGKPYNSREVGRALDDAMLTNPGLAQSLGFDINSQAVMRDVTRQMAASSRANSVIMNLWSPSNTLFNQIGFGQGGMSTGNRGNVVFKNAQSGQLTQPYGQPAVPPPGMRYAAPQGHQNGTVTQPQYGQYRGQSPMYRSGSVWGNFVHSSFAMGDDGNSFKYTFDRNGVFVGNEWNLTPSTAWGYTGWANYGTMRERWDKTTSNDYGLGLYLIAAPYEQFEVKSFIGFGFQQYKNDRYLRNDAVHISHRDEIFGIDEHYNSEVDGHSTNFSLELARPFTVSPNFVIRPVWGFEIQVMTQNGYREHPDNEVAWSNTGYNIVNDMQGPMEGNYALRYKKMDFSRSLTRIGFNTESYFARGGWQSRLYYANRFSGDKAPVSTQVFQSGSIPFKSKGGNLGSSYLQLGAGTHCWLNRDRTATLYFDADWDTSFGHGGYSWLNFAMGLQQNF